MHNSSQITTDLFLGEKLKIQQYKKGYRSGSDTVLLAAFIRGDGPQTILDVGCGAGVASLCAAYRLKEAHVTGIDIDPDAVHLATLNARANQMEDRCTFLVEDMRAISLPKQSFDHVFSNPPYFDGSSPSHVPQKSLARSQTFPITEWVQQCIKMAKPRGRVSFIYPTEDLNHLLLALKNLGDIHLFPLWPSKGKASKRILVSARKDVKCGLKLHGGLVLHSQQGAYTPLAQSILRKGAPIQIEL